MNSRIKTGATIAAAMLMTFGLAAQGDHHHHGMDADQGARRAAGRYGDSENWTRRGQTFELRYELNLSRDSGDAELRVSPIGDRNEPNDQHDTRGHGQILDYLHTGHSVTQTGQWWQKGDTVYIHFTTIHYGSTTRPKSERLSGKIEHGTIFTDTWDKDFYGDKAQLSFEPQ